jgi:hypothetical protein
MTNTNPCTRPRATRCRSWVLGALTLSVAAVLAACSPNASSRSAPTIGNDVQMDIGAASAPSSISADALREAQGKAASIGPGAGVAFTERKLVFNGDMSLQVEKVPDAMSAARTWAEGHGGFVDSENTTAGGEGEAPSGTMSLRVPREQYEASRTFLRGLAKVVLVDHSARQDVTGQYADLQARLKNLQAAETELQELLRTTREGGGKSEDVLNVFNRLTEVRGQIDQLQAQLDTMSEQVALSTVNVSFVSPPASAATVSQGWQPGAVFQRALADLVLGLEALANVAIYLVVTAPFWIALAVVVWLAYRVLRRLRRRKESVPAMVAPGQDVPPPAPPTLPQA